MAHFCAGGINLTILSRAPCPKCGATAGQLCGRLDAPTPVGGADPPDVEQHEHHWVGGNDGMFCTGCGEEAPFAREAAPAPTAGDAVERPWPADDAELVVDQMGRRGAIPPGANLTAMAKAVRKYGDDRECALIEKIREPTEELEVRLAKAVWDDALPGFEPDWEDLNEETRMTYRTEVSVMLRVLAARLSGDQL